MPASAGDQARTGAQHPTGKNKNLPEGRITCSRTPVAIRRTHVQFDCFLGRTPQRPDVESSQLEVEPRRFLIFFLSIYLSIILSLSFLLSLACNFYYPFVIRVI